MNKSDYVQAEPLYKRAIMIVARSAGSDPLFVATLVSELADMYVLKGEYQKAEPFYERVLAMREKTLGSNHPDVAMSLCFIARLHMLTGDNSRT